MLNLYTANLAKYNEGYLVGDWIMLPTDDETLSQHIRTVLGDNEEYAIHDYEKTFPIEIHEYSNIYALNRTMQALESVAEGDRQVIALIADDEGMPITQVIEEWTDGKYNVFPCNTLDQLGNYLNDNGLLGYEIPTEVIDYIDFENLADDWLMGGNYIDLSDHGFYITY